MNEEIRRNLEELGASDGLKRSVEMLPRVIAGMSFLAHSHELDIHEVKVAIYYSEKRGRVVATYVHGRINTNPTVNVFLSESFSANIGPRGGIKKFELRTFGSTHSFGTKTRRAASMFGWYYRHANQTPEIHESDVKVKIYLITSLDSF